MSAIAVVLAGGRSSRMGYEDKALKDLGGRPLLAHVLDRLAPQAAHIALNTNADPGLYAGFGLPVIPDSISGFAGPLAGILAGMEWTAGHHPDASHILTVAADTPFFPTNLSNVLEEAATHPTGRIALATSNGQWHPVFAYWPVAYRLDLRAWLAQPQHRRVREWIRSKPHVLVDFPLIKAQNGAYIDPFFNANTPEDLEQALHILRETGP
ncbi:MAG: molybdenum cofactor guanylyltransferase MobA [Phyllobacterium sp.]